MTAPIAGRSGEPPAASGDPPPGSPLPAPGDHEPRPPVPPRRRRGLAWAFTVFLVVGLSLVFWLLGFTEFGAIGLDLQAIWSPPAPGPQVVLVVITEHDDSAHFGGVRPFDPAVIDSIVRKARSGGARAVGVDLLTEHAAFGEHPGLRELAGEPDVVWAAGRECAGAPADEGTAPDVDPTACPGGRWRVRPPLGGWATSSGPATGAAHVELDRDLTLRRFRRDVTLQPGLDVPSFAAAVLRAAYPGEAPPAPDRRDYWIRYQPRDRFITYSVHDLLTADDRGFAGPFGPVRGRIVLVGGAPRQDYWMTPIGYQRGVEVWGHVLATESSALEQGRALHPVPPRVLRGVIEVLAGASALALLRLLSIIRRWIRNARGRSPERRAPWREWRRPVLPVMVLVAAGLAAWGGLGPAWAWYVAPIVVAVFILEGHEELMEALLQRPPPPTETSTKRDAG